VYRKVGYWALMLMLFATLATSGCSKSEEVVKEPEITVSTAAAQIQDLAKQVSYSGILRGQNEVYITPKVAARVTAIYVKPGDRVRTGQTLITLDNTDYVAGVKQAEAALQLNELQMESARADYERAQVLYDSAAISTQQMEQYKLKYDTMAAGTSQAQAALLAAQTAINHCIITSPINGVVGSIGLSLGDNANPAAPAAIVSDSSSLEVEIMVSEAEISYVKLNSPVEVYVKAAREAAFGGKVATIATVADPSQRNYAVKVVLDNPDGSIKSGMFAELYVDTQSKKSVLTVPVGAVMSKGGREIVYVVDQDSRAQETEVKSGIKNDQYVEIASGLQAGQQVIVKGNTLVGDDSLVKVVGGAQ